MINLCHRINGNLPQILLAALLMLKIFFIKAKVGTGRLTTSKKTINWWKKYLNQHQIHWKI